MRYGRLPIAHPKLVRIENTEEFNFNCPRRKKRTCFAGPWLLNSVAHCVTLMLQPAFMRLFLSFFLASFLWVSASRAQVTFTLSSLPAKYTPSLDTLFLAGNFNAWNPRDTAYRFRPNAAGQLQATVTTALAELQFKITRGSWAAVEVAASGADIANRTQANTPGSFSIAVADWADTRGTHTGTAQVSILTSQLWLAPLKRYRRIWICLPTNYQADPLRRFPVVYFHDGQNVFDAATSFAGEWKVDEALAQLEQTPGWEPLIAVGIDNGGAERINELTAFRHPTYGGGQGELYSRAVVECVKPLIDSLFRTKNEATHTAVAGSSLGGIETLYMGFERPQVFGKMLAFSPSLWFSDSLQTYLLQQTNLQNSRLYLLCGTNEGDADMVPDMNACYNALLANGFSPANITKQVIVGGTHSEGFWSQHVKAGLQWLFGTTTGVKKKDRAEQKPWELIENQGTLEVRNLDDTGFELDVQVYDACGRVIQTMPISPGRFITRPLQKGLYLVKVQIGGSAWVEKWLL